MNKQIKKSSVKSTIESSPSFDEVSNNNTNINNNDIEESEPPNDNYKSQNYVECETIWESSYYIVNPSPSKFYGGRAVFFNRDGNILKIVNLTPEEHGIKSSIRLDDMLDKNHVGMAKVTKIKVLRTGLSNYTVIFVNKNDFHLLSYHRRERGNVVGEYANDLIIVTPNYKMECGSIMGVQRIDVDWIKENGSEVLLSSSNCLIL